MDAEQRKNYLEGLHSLRFDELPDEALIFLGNYLMGSQAQCKVKHLLAEATRLHLATQYGDEHYEHVTYPESTPPPR